MQFKLGFCSRVATTGVLYCTTYRHSTCILVYSTVFPPNQAIIDHSILFVCWGQYSPFHQNHSLKSTVDETRCKTSLHQFWEFNITLCLIKRCFLYLRHVNDFYWNRFYLIWISVSKHFQRGFLLFLLIFLSFCNAFFWNAFFAVFTIFIVFVVFTVLAAVFTASI